MDGHSIEELPEWAQARFRELECEKNAEKERADAEKEHADAEKERADREEAEKKAEQARADREEAAKKAELARADREEARNRKTTFLDYLHNLHAATSSIRVETDRRRMAKGNVANVGDKVYPRVLRPWLRFPELHADRLCELAGYFAEIERFPSYNTVYGDANHLSPETRKDEQDIRPFIRATIEWPAMKIINAYLQTTTDPRHAQFRFHFSNGAYGLTGQSGDLFGRMGEPPKKKKSIDRSSTLAPDRWGIRSSVNGNDVHPILPGEYKAAHKAQGEGIRNVLAGTHLPAESLIDDCADFVRARLENKKTAASSAQETDQSSTAVQEPPQRRPNFD